MLELIDVSLSTHKKRLVGTLNARIENGRFLTVTGASGSGKSTLLSWIIGINQPHVTARGTLILNKRNITGELPNTRNIGILFQDDLLFPHMNIEDNLLFAVSGALRRKQRKRRVSESLADIKLEHLGKRFPHQLSGGEKSRVSLMRTLISNPSAILLDEPFSNLDSNTHNAIRTVVFEKIQTLNIPAIIVTHNPLDYPPERNTVISLNGVSQR